jgi:hypothetical protein
MGAAQRVARVLLVKDGRPDADAIAADLARWHAAALS